MTKNKLIKFDGNEPADGLFGADLESDTPPYSEVETGAPDGAGLSVKTEKTDAAETKPLAGNERDGAVGDGAEFVQIRRLVQEFTEATGKEITGKLNRLGVEAEKLAEAVEANGSALDKLTKIERRLLDVDEAEKELKDQNRVYTADFHRRAETQRSHRWWWSAVMPTIAVPAFFLLGVLVEQQFQIVPLEDPSGGWSSHIWEHYGRAIADCATEATRTNKVIECSFAVRKP